MPSTTRLGTDVKWLYDTSVVIALESDDRLDDLPVGEFGVSVVTIGELTVGLHLARAADRGLRIELIAELEHSWNPVPIDVAVMRRYATYVAECRRRDLAVGMADALIAATASVHGYGVVSRDRDFTKFDGLRVALV